jgi:Domain of unknown function (DUF4280)
MGFQICMGATLQCSFGTSPSPLSVLPANRVQGMTPAANIMDNKPFVNIMPFGQCSTSSNPAVAAATAAAGGAMTPMPCIPVTTSPWIVGAPTVLIGNMPALNDSSQLMCVWGGVIKIVSPGQAQIQVP